MTAFPWKIFRGSQELVFPEGARRYVSVDVEQIPGDGGIDRAYDGSVIILGDPAFRRHAVNMSCSGHTVAPVFDLWPNQFVTLEAPVEFAVSGSSAILANDPVAGSVYGVDELDRRIDAFVSGRTVNAPGAVAIRFRPVLECVVVSRTASKTQGRADGGWNIRLEELSGFEESTDSDRISFGHLPLQNYDAGVAYSLALGPQVTTNTGLPVSFAIVSGALPAGLSLNASTGVVSGTPSERGTFVVSVRASSAAVSATQTFVFYDEVLVPSVSLAAADLQSLVVGTAYSLALAPLTTIANSTAAATYSVVGGALPPGMSLNASTGVISGTPTANGAYAATVQAALPTGQIARETYAFSALAPVLSSGDQAPFFYENGVAFSRALNGLITIDGAPSAGLAVSYALAPGSALPPGLSLVSTGTPATFTVQGTPTGLHTSGQYVVVVIRATYGGATLDVPVFFADVSLDRDAVLSGGVEFDYIPIGMSGQNVPHRRYTFNESGSLTLLTSGWFTYALVGGGGPGGAGQNNNGGGGGAAGGIRMERIWRPAGAYTVTVGAGGAPGAASGGSTEISGPGGFIRNVGGGPAGARAVNATTGASGALGAGSSASGAAAGTSNTGAMGTADSMWGSSGGGSLANSLGGTPGGGGGYSGQGTTPTIAGHSGWGGGGLKLVFGTAVILLGCGGGGGARNGGFAGLSGANGQGTGGNGGATNTAGQAGQANRGNGGGGGGGGTTPGAGGAGGSGVAMFWTRRP
jgi:hypothetical protein